MSSEILTHGKSKAYIPHLEYRKKINKALLLTKSETKNIPGIGIAYCFEIKNDNGEKIFCALQKDNIENSQRFVWTKSPDSISLNTYNVFDFDFNEGLTIVYRQLEGGNPEWGISNEDFDEICVILDGFKT